MDIIADYGNLFLGMPQCDKFVLTFAANAYFPPYPVGLPCVEAYYSSLNNPTVSQSQIVAAASGAPTYTSYPFPDIAGIQRSNLTGVDDIALLTYNSADINNNVGLYYQEWNITQGTLSSPNLLHYGFGTPLHARIAAIDDYNINSPAAGLAYYNIAVWTSTSTSSTGIKIYNNIVPGGFDISTPYFGAGYFGGRPAVTAGPCSNYTVVYPQNIYACGDILVQSIDWTTGHPANTNYYQVNYSNPGGALGFPVSAAATCNGASSYYAPYALYAWDDSDNIGKGNYSMYQKFSDCSMAFKSSSVPAVNKTTWGLSPNPAIDVLTLTNDGAVQDAAYGITDVTGRTVAYAAVTGSKQQIDVSAMSPGMYVLTVYHNMQKIKSIKFVKE